MYTEKIMGHTLVMKIVDSDILKMSMNLDLGYKVVWVFQKHNPNALEVIYDDKGEAQPRLLKVEDFMEDDYLSNEGKHVLNMFVWSKHEE